MTQLQVSGVHKGVVKFLEDKLQQKVFFLARRYHISEIVILGVWEKVKSPDNPWFQKFWVMWPDIDKYTTIHTTNSLILIQRGSLDSKKIKFS